MISQPATHQALIAIDGTDSLSIRTQELGSIPTHVEHFQRLFQGTSVYYDGPVTSGSDAGRIASAASDQAIGWLASDVAYELSLVGWSRGGMIAVEVCKTIARYRPDVRIRFLGLFDPVDMSVRLSGGVVPNIAYAAIAWRDPAFGSWWWWSQASAKDVRKKVRVRSRDIPQERVITVPANLRFYGAEQHEKRFSTSHGGVGGALLAHGTSRDQATYMLGRANPLRDISSEESEGKMQAALVEQQRVFSWMVRHATNAGLHM